MEQKYQTINHTNTRIWFTVLFVVHLCGVVAALYVHPKIKTVVCQKVLQFSECLLSEVSNHQKLCLFLSAQLSHRHNIRCFQAA